MGEGAGGRADTSTTPSRRRQEKSPDGMPGTEPLVWLTRREEESERKRKGGVGGGRTRCRPERVTGEGRGTSDAISHSRNQTWRMRRRGRAGRREGVEGREAGGRGLDPDEGIGERIRG